MVQHSTYIQKLYFLLLSILLQNKTKSLVEIVELLNTENDKIIQIKDEAKRLTDVLIDTIKLAGSKLTREEIAESILKKTEQLMATIAKYENYMNN